MKLWLKIFLSILILSLTSLFIITSFVIYKNHGNNLTREQERSLNEFELICISLESNIDFNTSSPDTIKTIINRYGKYYEHKGIYLILYQENKVIYNELAALSKASYEDLLSVASDYRMVQILKGKNQHFMLVSKLLSPNNNTVLLYGRDISEIYEARSQSINLTIYLALLLCILLGFFSYYYSRWITKPLTTLQEGAKAVAAGNYSIRLAETDRDFSPVAASFNQMAGNVSHHTKELEEKARERQVFIDDLSHEMNTPLTSIQGYSEFLLSANATQEQKRSAAQSIYKDAKRMREMYNKLMTITFSREHAIDLEDINVQELLKNIEESFQLIFDQHKINFSTKTKLKTIKADRVLLHMLITNLINNSIQATQPGGSISILVYETMNSSVIEVKDNGCGIPKDKIKEVIKPFVRVDKSRSRKTGGAGLGLALVNNIAARHQSKLTIESEVGSGTCIKLIFPSTSK